MPTSLFFHCPGCNARIKAPLNLLGRWRVCPGCHTRFVVRNERKGKPQDADPVLVADDSGFATGFVAELVRVRTGA